MSAIARRAAARRRRGCEVEGHALHGQRPERVRRLGVAVVPEGHRVLGDLSVLDNLRCPRRRFRIARGADAVEQVLAVASRAARGRRRPRCFSSGEADADGLPHRAGAGRRQARAYLAIDERLSPGSRPPWSAGDWWRWCGKVTRARRRRRLLIEQSSRPWRWPSPAAPMCWSAGGWRSRDRRKEIAQLRPEILHSGYLAAASTRSGASDQSRCVSAAEARWSACAAQAAGTALATHFTSLRLERAAEMPRCC